MEEINSKSRLAMVLSGLKGFDEPKVREGQYITDSEVAAAVLWNANLLGDIRGKIILDLGCGTGILGVGVLLSGAKAVYFVDSDNNALEIAKKNISKVKSEGYELGKAIFRCAKVEDLEKGFGRGIHAVIQNPPFGTKVRHNDMVFLEKALDTAKVVYSFHKSESKGFLEAFSSKKMAKITHVWNFRFPLKATLAFHRRQIHRIDVSCFRFEMGRE